MLISFAAPPLPWFISFFLYGNTTNWFVSIEIKHVCGGGGGGDGAAVCQLEN